MRGRSIFVAVFPIAVTLILAVERGAMVLLDTFPGSPELWRVWLVLRQASGNFWGLVERFFAISAFTEIGAVGVAIFAIWQILSRARPLAVRFLANHAALLGFGAMVAAGQPSMVASIFDQVPVLGGFHFPAAIEINGLTATVLVMGLCACGYCHFCYLSTALQRTREIGLALRVVERNL